MRDFTTGQGKLQFEELAEELHHPTVGNKRNQETRWARAQLSASQSYFRNLPTLYIYYGRQENAAAVEGNLTEQKSMKKKVEDLADGEKISFAVGICQLLDSYAAASLSSKHLRFFPTPVLKEIAKLQTKLNIWSEKWNLEEEVLFHAIIGAAADIIGQ